MKRHEGILEEITFDKELAEALLLLPVKSDIQDVFSSVINECNEYGNFVRQDIIITNVKRMTTEEIRDFIDRKGNNEESD